MSVQINDRHLASFVAPHELDAMAPAAELAARSLEEGSGLGNDFLGWLHLPARYDRAEFARIGQAAARIRSDSAALVVIGIGGSYLGARSAVELLTSPFYNQLPKKTPDIYFAGNGLSGKYLSEIIALLGDRDFSVNVISKSGTTTEPALAFRVFRGLLEKKYGRAGAAKRIYATTDRARGTLKELADREGWQTFVIPDDVGGRYSVLTAVGLLPMACAGIDISAVMAGAARAEAELAGGDVHTNPACRYAALRNILCRKGKTTEVFVSYEPAFQQTSEWLKQLFGESEGKDKKGIFPASVGFTTDLHSMGQFIQDGYRGLFETVVDIREPLGDFDVEKDAENADGLNFLAGQKMSEINRRAMEGTVLAHTDGGAPNLILELPRMDADEYGQMVYFFEKACAVSGYLSGVNPFDQPGVESYKKNMFALLGKPGYEGLRAELENKLK